MPVHRSKRSLMDIFADYSPKQMTNGQIRMECPFRENHEDGSGRISFFVSPDKNAYHCFSCNEHGNLVNLLTTKFEVGYFDAMELVTISDFEKKDSPEFELDLSWRLIPPEDFLKRGFKKETLKHFRIGLSEDNKIIIPFYRDFKTLTELVGYQSRTNYPTRVVRNSKNFKKSEYLYNLDFSYDYVIVVEGYSDVMRLYQHGYNATALLGADMSSWQASQVAKFPKVYLALDNDNTGRRATEICYHQLKNETEVLLVPYTSKDPGECISPKVWGRFFHSSTDYVEYSMEMAIGWDDYLDTKDKVLRELKNRKE